MVTPPKPSLFINRWFTLTPDVVMRTVWQERMRILVTMVAVTGLGVGVAFLLKPEFRSEARIMPEMNTGSGDMFKRLASVAGFAGMDFAETEGIDAVRPDLYPNVLQSTPFVLYLLNQPVITTNGQQTTIGTFLVPDDSSWSLKRLFTFTRKELFSRPLPESQVDWFDYPFISRKLRRKLVNG